MLERRDDAPNIGGERRVRTLLRLLAYAICCICCCAAGLTVLHLLAQFLTCTTLPRGVLLARSAATRNASHVCLLFPASITSAAEPHTFVGKIAYRCAAERGQSTARDCGGWRGGRLRVNLNSTTLLLPLNFNRKNGAVAAVSW